MLLDPKAIEEKSLAVIEEELGTHSFPPRETTIIKQVICDTADFDFSKNMVFHPNAIDEGVKAIRLGVDIIADVQMVEVGILKDRLRKFGGSAWCFVFDQDVIAKAKEKNLPRSIVSIQKGAANHPNGIFVIGNTPTALTELIHLVELGRVRPALLIGVPVDFLSIDKSKERLASLKEIPFITCRGRKGGPQVAVAIVNALSLLATSSSKPFPNMLLL